MQTVFEMPVREFKTRIAAEKFAARIIGGASVRAAAKSAFDMYAAPRKYYQVFPAQGAGR